MNLTTQELHQLEADLWTSADDLRANSKLNASEYSMPVLGLIFLRHATNRFYTVKAQIEAGLPSRGGVKPPVTAADFRGRAALYLPAGSRYDDLVALPDDDDIGAAIDSAMTAIEAQSEMLGGALPKDYNRFEPALLRRLLRIFNSAILQQATGDLFGRIYEYFLNKFAMSGAQEGGEFFTPPSLVRMIVNIIEPDHGIMLDPAFGSAGMFVQTGHFLEDRGQDPAHAVIFYGQEKSELNTRLARMNLAVHGLEGHVTVGNTFYDSLPDLIGRCDRVMANPPFNVDMVDPERVKSDPRLPFGLPGISAKTKTVSNANYLWIQYFYTYLNDQGRAGFVMASSASDAGHGEKLVRQKLVNTGHVDVMLAIGTNFFYTRSLPCTLWFFDKAKPPARQDQVLMLDARAIYRVVSRKIRDFSEEQLKNLTAIVWLYRGQSDRFLALVAAYLAQTHHHATTIAPLLATLHTPLTTLHTQLQTFAATLPTPVGATNNSLPLGRAGEGPPTPTPATNGSLPDPGRAGEGFPESLAAFTAALTAGHATDQTTSAALAAYAAWYTTQDATLATNTGQHAAHARFAPLVDSLKSLQKSIAERAKLADHALAHAEKTLDARRHPAWNAGAVRNATAALETARHAVSEAIKTTLYTFAQVTWLQSRFPAATYCDVPGLCKVVTQAEITAHDHSLTPGRYVGVGSVEMSDDENFEERLQEIHVELAGLNEEAVTLATKIQLTFEELL